MTDTKETGRLIVSKMGTVTAVCLPQKRVKTSTTAGSLVTTEFQIHLVNQEDAGYTVSIYNKYLPLQKHNE